MIVGLRDERPEQLQLRVRPNIEDRTLAAWKSLEHKNWFVRGALVNFMAPDTLSFWVALFCDGDVRMDRHLKYNMIWVFLKNGPPIAPSPLFF